MGGLIWNVPYILLLYKQLGIIFVHAWYYDGEKRIFGLILIQILKSTYIV